MLKWWWLFCCISCCWANVPSVVYSGPQSINDKRHEYYIELLKQALLASEAKFGSYQLQSNPMQMVQSRRFMELGNSLDVTWSMTSVEREENALAIPIPLMKGLLGYRVLVIKSVDLERFSAVNSLQQLQNFLAYQGHDWPDTEILRSNGLQVNIDSRYEALFSMLKHGRYDYFPRGVLEAWAELDHFKLKGLTVEPKLLLVYPTAVYFFVGKDNHALQQRIEYGLQLMIADGRFDALFYQYPKHQHALTQAKLAERTVLYLDNPLQPASLPLQQANLWHVMAP